MSDIEHLTLVRSLYRQFAFICSPPTSQTGHPIAAGVDPVEAMKLDQANLGPDTQVPMKATGFAIKEGMSWQVTNTLEF
ncbi:MAG: hypothetical protein SFV32_09620 [Opitutaceae bacterium]|nr:hypothetical protein [Opitutaceae bacterium]